MGRELQRTELTREAIRLTRFAHKTGADGALKVAPYYNKPTQEGYYRHFAAVTEAVEMIRCAGVS